MRLRGIGVNKQETIWRVTLKPVMRYYLTGGIANTSYRWTETMWDYWLNDWGTNGYDAVVKQVPEWLTFCLISKHIHGELWSVHFDVLVTCAIWSRLRIYHYYWYVNSTIPKWYLWHGHLIGPQLNYSLTHSYGYISIAVQFLIKHQMDNWQRQA
jgi:hypothetical protein